MNLASLEVKYGQIPVRIHINLTHTAIFPRTIADTMQLTYFFSCFTEFPYGISEGIHNEEPIFCRHKLRHMSDRIISCRQTDFSDYNWSYRCQFLSQVNGENIIEFFTQRPAA